MITTSIDPPQVKAIDFDWRGKHGEGGYPTSLNDNGDKIKWHPDGERLR
jgi:hypothetical protein